MLTRYAEWIPSKAGMTNIEHVPTIETISSSRDREENSA